MPRFKYRAFDETGSFVESEVNYPTQETLIADLQQRGLSVIEIVKLERGEEEKEKKPPTLTALTGGKVSDRDLSIFCRQLGTMINAGLNIIDALNILGEQLPSKRLADASKRVATMVSEGRPISSSMAEFPAVFPKFIVNLVRVGEETGNLDVALIRAADYYEKMAMIKSKIKSAAFYPTFVVIIATAIVTGILYFLVPTFGEIYASLGGELPAPTQMLIAASNALRSNLLFILAFVVGFSLLFRFLMNNSYQFRKSVHSFMLRAPKMGDLVMKSTMAKFARTMAALFSSGVVLERAFEIAGQVTGNVIIREALESAKKGVIEGEPMHKALEKTGMFPRLIIAMVRVGEDTGRLDEMLDTIARFYEDEFDKAVEGMIKLIEPMLIVFIGGIVGAILIALYMPIFKLGELIK
ncbi:MAG: type II secretion system F family protein [Aquificaceae bacterium]|jgi:type IV pilus assembly protein PilC|uniref:type II secretion system F family protein n=1 Tax=Hydrogenobacter sp. Uz 6-8 TaxID=3384828 RepID=UPI000F18EFEB|nr:MAG: type II secretion system F family protein [Aquificota bacterium]